MLIMIKCVGALIFTLCLFITFREIRRVLRKENNLPYTICIGVLVFFLIIYCIYLFKLHDSIMNCAILVIFVAGLLITWGNISLVIRKDSKIGDVDFSFGIFLLIISTVLFFLCRWFNSVMIESDQAQKSLTYVEVNYIDSQRYIQCINNVKYILSDNGNSTTVMLDANGKPVPCPTPIIYTHDQTLLPQNESKLFVPISNSKNNNN